MKCDILIVGASTGGVAAALSAASTGASVYLIEESKWLGGQLTAQGVSTPDEQPYIEQFGGTRSYSYFRNKVRQYYRDNYKSKAEVATDPFFNPGKCWVSRLSFEPKVGHNILEKMLKPFVESGQLKILYETEIVNCIVEDDRIVEMIVRSKDQTDIHIQAKYILDATDLGELLPLCGEENIDWVVGAESQSETGEPDAPENARLDWVQPFTFPFAIDWSPETAASNVIVPPKNYQELKALQKYSIKHGAITGLFAGEFPWWSYRRLLAKDNFDDASIKSDLVMINTAGNDFYGGNVIGTKTDDKVKIKQTLGQARLTSLGYLYWLQTECPREDDPSGNKKGYPEFRLRKDIFDTEDGCSPKPYIRESRRIKSLRPILEQEIVVSDFKGNICRGENARAAFMADSVGVGYYPLDIHSNGHGEPSAYVPTRPFQIPLGSLIPKRLKNLLPACKNIGTTHLTNGAYRLHPIEWNIGESVGLIAGFCLVKDCFPYEIHQNPASLNDLQKQLLKNGILLNWYIDVPIDHPAFEAVQMLACAGITLGSDTDLLFHPDEKITPQDWQQWVKVLKLDDQNEFNDTRGKAAIFLYEQFKLS